MGRAAGWGPRREILLMSHKRCQMKKAPSVGGMQNLSLGHQWLLVLLWNTLV